MKGFIVGGERFRDAFAKVPIGMILQDKQGRLVESNLAFAEMLGYDEEELRGMSRADLSRLGGAEEDASLYEELARGKRESLRVEKRYIRKDGRAVWGRLSAALCMGSEETLVVGIVEDIDERRAAEEALTVSERRFRAVIEQSPVSTHLFTLNGRTIITNAAWDDLWNVARVPEGSDIFEDEQLAATGLLPYVQESLAGQVAVETPPLLFDPAGVGRKGRERWLEASIYPIRDDDERVSEMVLMVEDITERKTAQDKIEASEERFRSLVQNALDIITILDTDGVIRYESPAIERILGYAPDDLIGETAFDLVHPDDMGRVREAFGRAVRSGGVSEAVAYRFRCLDGSWRYLESICSVPNGEVDLVTINSRDVTERVRAEEDLKLKNRAIDASSNGILISGPAEEDYQIVYYNPALERITGYSAGEVIGNNARFLQGSDRDQPDSTKLKMALEEGREWFGVLRNYKKDGTLFWNEMYVAPVYGEDGRLTNYVGIQNDVTGRKALEEQLAHQAFHDSLTGLPNRALFLDRLEQALRRARRRGEKVAVLFMDLDNFKHVNDSLGHEAGDRLLVCVAERVRKALRPSDTVARLGGDEFTVLIEDLADEKGAVQAAERISKELAKPIPIASRDVHAAFSIGISVSASEEDLRGGDMLRDADAAMYEAKKKGKDRHQTFEPGMGLRAAERFELESALRKAIGDGELRLHYQPEASLKSGEVLGVEALVRWEHPERGLVSPGDFIPLAEETGLIVGMGRWVLGEACRQAKAWRERWGGSFTVWVNLSARQFQQPNLAQEVSAILEEAGLLPENLGLEITESSLMEYGGATIATLKGLKSLGIKLAIDDFGTGYSSLSYLKQLPVDHLKIDRSFVAGLGKNPEDEVLVSAMINLAHALSLKVVAEGVETADQLQHLAKMECDFVQGYHLSRPLPSDAASTFLRGRLAG